MFTPHLFGESVTYGDGGFAVHLPYGDSDGAIATMSRLQQHFVGPGTRAVAFSFSHYNAGLDLVTVTRALLELSATGYVEPTATIRTMKMLLFDDVLGVLESEWPSVLLLLGALYFMKREFVEVREETVLRYLSSFWNLLDVTQLVFVLVSARRFAPRIARYACSLSHGGVR